MILIAETNAVKCMTIRTNVELGTKPFFNEFEAIFSQQFREG
jgi:hypothetical protein